jgi:hypothetical protein
MRRREPSKKPAKAGSKQLISLKLHGVKTQNLTVVTALRISNSV